MKWILIIVDSNLSKNKDKYKFLRDPEGKIIEFDDLDEATRIKWINSKETEAIIVPVTQ